MEIPRVTIIAPADGSRTKDTAPILDFTIIETNPGSNQVQVDGLEVNKNSGDHLDTLAYGTHALTVTHTDAAGNTGLAETVFTVDPAEGDLNGDGAVGLADALIVLAIQANNPIGNPVYPGAAVNKTQIQMGDALFILQEIAGGTK